MSISEPGVAQSLHPWLLTRRPFGAENRRADHPAAEALGSIGRGARPAVPTLLDLQSDQALAVRQAATRALVLIVLDGNGQG